MKNLWLIGFVFFVLTGCNSAPLMDSENPINPPEIFILQKELITPQINLTGNIEAQKHIPISSKIAGRVEQVFVEVGDLVQKGDVLARYLSIDNENQILYQNALQSLASAKSNSQNTVSQAQIQTQSIEKSLHQVKKEQTLLTQKSFDTLSFETQKTKTTLTNALHFLDQALQVSPQYKTANPSLQAIGKKNSRLRQFTKNQLSDILADFKKLESLAPQDFLETDLILEIAQSHLTFGSSLKTTLTNFDILVRDSITSSYFSVADQQNWQTKTENMASALDLILIRLKELINQAAVQQEQEALALLSQENLLDESRSQLKLSESMAQNQIITAQNQLNLAQNFKEELLITAPFSGIITDKSINVGQFVVAGETFFTLADISQFKINTDIPDTYLGALALGQTITNRVDGLANLIFTGKITKIDPAVNPQTRKIGIEITLDPKNTEFLKIGLFARINIEGKPHNGFFVPSHFIHYGFEAPTIRLEDQTEKIVTLGIEKKGLIEIFFEGIVPHLKIIR